MAKHPRNWPTQCGNSEQETQTNKTEQTTCWHGRRSSKGIGLKLLRGGPWPWWQLGKKKQKVRVMGQAESWTVPQTGTQDQGSGQKGQRANSTYEILPEFNKKWKPNWILIAAIPCGLPGGPQTQTRHFLLSPVMGDAKGRGLGTAQRKGEGECNTHFCSQFWLWKTQDSSSAFRGAGN